MDNRTIVLLHGIGGPDGLEPVLDLLSDHLGSRGYDPLAREDLVVVDYDAILAQGTAHTEPLKETWTRPRSEAHEQARAEFVARAARIRARLDRTQDEAGSLWGAAPQKLADLASMAPPMAQVGRYARSADVRWAVRRTILARLSGSDEIILIGHSLGTVIAVDLIPYLPEGLVVRSLVTLASPLGFVPRLRAHSDLMSHRDDFPYDRVRSWTNLYNPADPVTGGRGIGARFPRATDAPIAAGGHGLRNHLNHPATLEVLEEALAGTYLPATLSRDVERPLADDWIPQLLAFAWSQRLGDTYAGKSVTVRRQLRGARAEVARRSVEQYLEQLGALAEEVEAAGPLDDSTNARVDQLRALPTEAELVDGAGELLAGRLDDRTLVTMLVPGISAWPASPFQVADRPSWEQRHRALEMLLARVRVRGAGRLPQGDTDLARLIIDHVQQAQKDMGSERSGAAPWWVLAGVGAMTLAAVPFTLGASIPAGLSGAAALTAGLAALGPGGMAGGIATIATLSGAGALAAGAGAGFARAEESDYDRRRRTQRMARDSRQLRSHVMELPAPYLREMLTNILAAWRISEDLGGDSADMHYPMVQRVTDGMRAEYRLHEEFAPRSDVTKDWAERLKVLERFTGHLRPAVLRNPEPLTQKIKEIESGSKA